MSSVTRITLSRITDEGTASSAVNWGDQHVSRFYEVGPDQLEAASGESMVSACADFSGNVYVADVDAHCIYKINEGGEISLVAGDPGTSGNNGTLANVPALDARFSSPRGICVSKSGEIYVADAGNNQIRKIKDGFVSTVAGAGDSSSGFTDGTGGDARFDFPVDVCVDRSGFVFVADYNNNSIRRISPEGAVYTYAGSTAGDGENVAATTYALFTNPSAVTVDNNGVVYVCDSGNYKIKTITPRGWVYHFAGSGTQGKEKGTDSFDSEFFDLTACDHDWGTNLYVMDRNPDSGSRLIKFNNLGVSEIVADFTDADLVNDVLYGLAVTPAGKLFVVASEGAPDESSSESSDGDESSSSESSSSSL